MDVIGSTEMPCSLDEEGILIGAVDAAAILDDLQSAGGDLFSGPVIQ